MRVIYIISFPPKYAYVNMPAPDYSWKNAGDELIGIWRNDRGHVFAKEVKRYFPHIDFEVWRLDNRADKEYIHTFQDGVIHKSFPAQEKKFSVGLKKRRHWISQELINKLHSIINDYNRKTIDLIIHIPVDFSYFTYIILKKFYNKVPFLHTSHLNPCLLKPSLRTANPIKLLHRLCIRITYNSHLNLMREIAVTPDRIDFFKANTRANIYKLDSLNFDFKWAKNKITQKDARIKIGYDPEQFLIFSSSRLVKEKQLDIMINSLIEVKDLDFHVIISGSGENEYKNYLEKLVDSLGLSEKVSFVGFLDQDLLYYYCASDVFLTTSSSEAGPVSAIKAMALNIPVISTDTGIVAYLLKKHDAGMLLDKKNKKYWGRKLREIISGGKLKTINPELLAEEFGLEKSIKQLVGYYQNSINNFKEHFKS